MTTTPGVVVVTCDESLAFVLRDFVAAHSPSLTLLDPYMTYAPMPRLPQIGPTTTATEGAT